MGRGGREDGLNAIFFSHSVVPTFPSPSLCLEDVRDSILCDTLGKHAWEATQRTPPSVKRPKGKLRVTKKLEFVHNKVKDKHGSMVTCAGDDVPGHTPPTGAETAGAAQCNTPWAAQASTGFTQVQSYNRSFGGLQRSDRFLAF